MQPLALALGQVGPVTTQSQIIDSSRRGYASEPSYLQLGASEDRWVTASWLIGFRFDGS